MTLEVLITDLHKYHNQKTFEMVDKRSNMQLDDLNSNPHGGPSLWNLLNHIISTHYDLLRSNQQETFLNAQSVPYLIQQ